MDFVPIFTMVKNTVGVTVPNQIVLVIQLVGWEQTVRVLNRVIVPLMKN